ncbi:S-ribosylhomocysteine lyase [Ethanoligenens harbinense]|uniref:S-ribosylhomocysteine lyase n=1 Tax=Ethanoligenens harbinense (strain DSM 18485 / JCM 12961 / CGMCC 1.5033 / YUAN-3) TaxID=663278 RepID=E6U7J1_ETHHY|nr:S-ribosylhomocysteine lyase [Ethanoligenens harbinense]ADU27014.1 quorum-sensing autoinducer 2 (AI-2), LuxS [Ethanoligenens harbinense YUAN-3]AVQ96102.1 S-ribosylhomocysteine lyase [Ethanoligenens harbinense YUAN-3]AYF38763.1 S-ribosylhomocysteine lyase [Ethanoligenens harbinense]AYF41511.1 S-ribosylhomocysteine lyase [Ethanoligenens harbinense]QCN92343.1 S-ribosylhomocysteine lyase [Ethanoligenens harbinense]
MEKIASFQVDHDTLKKGMYISRIDGDIITYDLRFKVPNAGDYLDNAAIHTFEHLFATYVRNTAFSDKIIYFGPMGCRTGFYFITRGLPHETAIDLTRKALQFVLDFEGTIPGSARSECGNYLNHDLVGAQREAGIYLDVMRQVTPASLRY